MENLEDPNNDNESHVRTIEERSFDLLHTLAAECDFDPEMGQHIAIANLSLTIKPDWVYIDTRGYDDNYGLNYIYSVHASATEGASYIDIREEKPDLANPKSIKYGHHRSPIKLSDNSSIRLVNVIQAIKEANTLSKIEHRSLEERLRMDTFINAANGHLLEYIATLQVAENQQ